MARLALPVKGWVQRFGFVLLVGFSIGLMILGRAESRIVEQLRIAVTDAMAPVLDVVSRPTAAVAALAEEIEALVNLRSENARLRQENERLRQWHAAARALERQNAAYATLLNVVEDPRPAFITARVIADAGGAFVRTLLLNAGARDGVRNGQAVINGDGLVGRVVESGRRSARILLITDLNSRIPVVVESTRVPAILAGDNSDRPRLTFLPVGAVVKPGERIVTSGQGGRLPPGLPVGEVFSVSDGVAGVRPFVNWHTLEYLRVLDYALPGALPSTRPSGRAGPLR